MKLFQTDKEDLKAAVMNLVRNLPITIEYMAAATLVSTIFFHFSNNVTNISIIFTLAIILIARATSCYGSGILASLFAVFWVNFAYTYPYMTLNFTMSGYPITFVGMMLISCITSSYTAPLNRGAFLATARPLHITRQQHPGRPV